MSGSITFRRGPFQDWSLTLYGTYADDGRLVEVLVQTGTPYNHPEKRGGMLSFAPGIDGFEQAHAAEVKGGPERMQELLHWVVEATRAALDRRTDIPADDRAYWQGVVDHADHTRADFFARYPDGTVPPFEIIGGNTAGHTLAGAR